MQRGGHRTGRVSGFTLIEAFVVMAVVVITAAIGFPALWRMIHRSKMEGFVRETAILAQSARLEAIKRGTPSGVKIDFAKDLVIAFRDENRDGDYDAGEDLYGGDLAAALPLPSRVFFWAPGEDPEAENAVVGFPLDDASGGAVLFASDGSTTSAGAFRFGDRRGNFLEINVAPAATGKVEIRKHNPALPERDGDHFYAPGELDQPWEWY